MMKFRVVAHRTAVYEVEAETSEEAIDLMIGGAGDEVDGSTEDIKAIPICGNCDADLVDGRCPQCGDKDG